MKKFHSNSIKALAFSASAIAFVIAGPVYAQDAEEQPAAEDQEEEPADVTTDAAGRTEQGNITVTGSRIVRDTYSSISPLQVISNDMQQAVGAFDPTQILQRSEAAAGLQIDATFNGFVLDNGPGSETINLRGLDASRTLLLVNGRRLAPAGVEGAPTSPSTNLIPASLVDRFDLLLDGASSIYGSDAVAGVINIILRKDFDGLELFAAGDLNEQGAGNDYTISGAWGFNTDRAVFGIGAEYRVRDEIRLKDRDFFDGCDTHYEIDQNGNIRTVDLRSNATIRNRTPGVTVSENECKITSQVGRFSSPAQTYGTLWSANGVGNSGIRGYDVSFTGGRDIDTTPRDGVRDVDFQNKNRNGTNLEQIFLSRQELINVMAYGEYTFPGEANITPFFEANYTRAEIGADNTGAPQLFPFVPGSNPFNPCNLINNDCSAAEVTLLGRPGGNTGFSLPVQPVLSIQGDRNNFAITQEQYRGVLGVRGDLPFIGSSWTFELSGVYSRSIGKSLTRGIREDKLALALGIDPTADFNRNGIVDNNRDGIADDYNGNSNAPPLLSGPCGTGLRNPNLAMPDLLQGCVPVNLFAPGALNQVIGDFATAEERAYVFGERRFDTTYEQAMLSGFITGDLFELPAGPVGVVIGAEWREDTISSSPNREAANGLFFGFSADQGASGSKWIREIYGEIDVPLEAGKTLVEELSVNLSGRLTDEELYGTNGTFAIKGGWRPVAPLLFKFSYGTSFRAPNLRENFLRGQSGFLTLSDPCAVPFDAYNTATGQYVAAEDERDPAILANCRREGRDPTRVGLNPANTQVAPFSNTGVEITTGGSLDIEAETSRSITTGFAFEESFAGDWEVGLNFNYYDIKLKGSIVEPSAQFIINDCFTRQEENRSPFCDRIATGPFDATSRGLISNVASGFINLNQESVRGIDLNARFSKEVTIGEEAVRLNLILRAAHLIERSSLFIGDDGEPSFDEDSGEFGFPSWDGAATFFVDVSDFRFTWETRWIGRVEQEEDFRDPLSDAFGFGPDGRPTGVLADTCLGGGSRFTTGPNAGQPNGIVQGDGIYCRNVGFADDYFEHTASIRYNKDNITLTAGVTNLLDRAPPQVDSTEVFAVNNVAIGNGYDLDGREFFASVRYRF
ncbi:TonB-dependent receptor domain-containing protein [Porphyrobacter sp. ULC335]|uniref:TonB-dependent receptor domain-containing protein n=1 Tax=Porphyrobacter sp. ULC335 TaxID=2854260 RepID=UPI00221F0DA1|nr:TonB-dependent receptor [Porphyrobacter sp. ULC335]UYV17164.1 TonB-dependent receptor [Porphyrobacter sp. ULC335]